jgi:DNA-directed RNA polymerase specialized sigma24 family protein
MDPQDDFEVAFPRLLRRAHAVGARILRDRTLAEDIAAETLTRAVVRWPRVQRMRSPDAWVTRVATNLAIDAIRRDRRSRQAHGPIPAVTPPAIGARMELQDAIGQLPRRQREVVALRFLVDLSESDVASVLGISVGSVKTHAHRALQRLREYAALLEGDVDGRD